MKLYEGKQHWIDDFNYNEFAEKYFSMSYEGQRGFIDSFDISTNPEWLKLKRGHLGASTAKAFLADSQKVSAMKRTKGWKEATEEEKRVMLEDIPVEDRLGDTCKELAFKLIAERRTSWVEPEATWSEKTSIKRGLCFEQFSTALYKRLTGLEALDFLFLERDDLMGFSPDKIVYDGDKRVSLEIKNFEPPAYYKAILGLEKPETIAQIQMQIYMGNLDRVDLLYTSFEDNSYKLYNYMRDEEFMKEFARREKEFKEYLSIVEKNINQEIKVIK